MYCSVKCLFCFNSKDRLSVVYCQMDLNSLAISNKCLLFEIGLLLDSHTTAAASVRESIYLSCALDACVVV